MTLLLWTLLPPPWKYCAAVAPVAGFFASRWFWQWLGNRGRPGRSRRG